jgi:hypothetical protein
MAPEPSYQPAVASIQSVRHAEDARQNTETAPVACRQGCIFRMRTGWQGLAMIAGEESDEPTLQPGEGKILRLHDQAKSCLVMAPDPFYPADVMEHRTALEDESILRPEAMELNKRIEQLERQPRHLVGVSGFILTAPSQSHDSLQAKPVLFSRAHRRRSSSGPRRASRELSQRLPLQEHTGKVFGEPGRAKGLDRPCHVVADPPLLEA